MNFSAGCETVVSNIVMVITVIISLEALTRLLYFTPNAILASIIISALPGLIDVHEAYNIYKVDKLDFLALTGAFFGVLFGSVEIGLLVAVTSSYHKMVIYTHTCMHICFFHNSRQLSGSNFFIRIHPNVTEPSQIWFMIL